MTSEVMGEGAIGAAGMRFALARVSLLHEPGGSTRHHDRGHIMADDKSKRGSPDNKRLNKSEPYEVAYAKAKRASGANGAKSATSAKNAKSTNGSSKNNGTAKKASAEPARKRTSAAPRAQPTATSVRAAPNPPKQEKTAENTAPKTMKEADAVDLLTDDHLQVSALFKKYEKLADKDGAADQREALAATICGMLKAHTTVEEEIFYPAARAAGIEADLLDEADIEHASAKDLIAQIESGSPDDDHYDAKVKVLGDYVTHHVIEEQTEMFPKCRRAGMDLVALRAEMKTRKLSLMPEDTAPKSRKGAPAGLFAKVSETLFSKG